MKLSPSTKRSLRTVFHGVLALITVVPAMIALLPSDSPLSVQLASVVAGVGVVSKVVNMLEDKDLIPTWMKD